MNWALALTASQFLFPPNATLEQRQAVLKKFFSPQPGERLTVKPRAGACERLLVGTLETR